MTSTTAAGSTLAISVAAPVSLDIAGYSALTYLEIGQIEKIGTIGAAFAKVEFQPLKGPKQKYKGSIDFGTLQPSLAHDYTDAGQTLLRTAAHDETAKLYTFLATYPTGAKRYFRGRVFGYPETVDGADTIVTAAPTIEICTPIVKDGSATSTPAPSFLTQPSITGAPAVGQPLSALTYVDGTVANGAITARAYLLAGAAKALSYILVAGDAGAALTFRNDATGTDASSISATSVAVTVLALPVNSVLPAISGTAQEGQVLTASTGTWTGAPTGYAYQWNRGGAAIAGAINSTRTLTSADVGAVITCTVTATNATGSIAATSGATSAVIAATVVIPVNSVAPAVSGTAGVGSVLTTTNGTWSGSPSGYTYAWRRDGVDISGATTATYALVAADAGHSIASRVYATNAGGTAGATSNAIAVAALPTLTLTGPLTYVAGAAAGTLVANVGNVPAGSTPTITPNDGRLVVAGGAGAWTIVTGMTASSAGSIALSVAAAGANGASGTVVVTGSASSFPAADLFAFSDNPASGNTYVRDRPGWTQTTADVRSQNGQIVTGGNLSFGADQSANSFTGQDLGRMDGGQLTLTIAGAPANGWYGYVNYVNENTYIYWNLAAARNRLRVFKVISGASTTLYDTGVLGTAFNIGDVFAISYAWSGSTCTVTIAVNGARYPNGTTSWTAAASGALQPSSFVGALGFAGIYSAYSAGFNGASPLPRLTLDKVKRLYQRDKATGLGSVSISGMAKGLSAIQFRLLQGGALVSGWEYGSKSIASLTVDGTTGVYSGTISGIPPGVGYQIQVRDSVDLNAGSLSRAFDVGAQTVQFGQSLATQGYQDLATPRTELVGLANAWFPWSNAPATDQAVNPISFASEWDWSGMVPGGNTWLTNKSKTGFATGFRANNPGLALGWFCGGYGSHRLATFLSSDSSVPYTAGPNRTLWQNLSAMVAWMGDFEVFVWDQGQEDAGRVYSTNSFGATEAAAYKTNFVNYIAAVRALAGRAAAQMPVLIVPIGRMYPAGGAIGNYASDAAYDLFFRTQVELTGLVANCYLGASQSDLTLASTTASEPHLSGTDAMGYVEKELRVGYDVGRIVKGSGTDRRGALPLSVTHSGSTLAITLDANGASALACAASIATNFAFWSDNSFSTAMTPTAMAIGALAGGQFVVTFTFAGATAAGNVVSSGKGGAYSVGGSYPDAANALKATQADGRGVITWPVSATAPGYLTAS